MSFAELIDRIISLAFKKHREEEQLNFSFDTNILNGITLSRGKE